MEGVKGDSVELWTIYNTEDDTKENIIYLAAYLNKTENTSNRHVAMWDGTKYVAVDTFTTTYTVTTTKQVQVTEASTSTEHVYVPAGTLKAEEGMTWTEWLTSIYNTTGEATPKIKTTDFEDISKDSVIASGETYGFVSVKVNTLSMLSGGISTTILPGNEYMFNYEDGMMLSAIIHTTM